MREVNALVIVLALLIFGISKINTSMAVEPKERVQAVVSLVNDENNLSAEKENDPPVRRILVKIFIGFWIVQTIIGVLVCGACVKYTNSSVGD